MIAERVRPLAGALLILIGFFALVQAAMGAEPGTWRPAHEVSRDVGPAGVDGLH